MTGERKPFDPGCDYKREFRKWVLEQFPDLASYRVGRNKEYPEFTERVAEVHQGAMLVLERIMAVYRSGESLHEYYRQDFEVLPKLFEERDWRKYATKLDAFLDAIEVE